MSKIVIVVFDSEKEARNGAESLKLLHEEGSISLYSMSIVTKNTDGSVAVNQRADRGPLGVVVGLITGSLAGLLGGPIGVAIGATLGTAGGIAYTLSEAEIAADFMGEVKQKLGSGKSAVIVEVEEDSEHPIDSRMQAIGGIVFRRTRREIVHAQMERDAAALDADSARRESAANLELKEKLRLLEDQAEKAGGEIRIRLLERAAKVRAELANQQN